MESCPKSLEKFVDIDKCLKLIKDVQETLSSPDESSSRVEAELLIENFRKTIDFYQEQPELLDPHLNELITKLIAGLEDSNISRVRYHTIFKFLYQLIKVSGFKSIGKKFPHETDKLPLLIELLSKEDTKDKANWQTRFVLTVWLSIVILTPFDLAKFDSNSNAKSISDRIYQTLLDNLRLYDSCQHVTAFCLAKFFSRPDILSGNAHVDQFISLALKELAEVKLGPIVNSVDDIILIGYLKTLAYMFKFVPRTEMKKRSSTILDVIFKLDVAKIDRELVTHLIIKTVQRCGLALLPKRVAAWRYKRGSRILGHVASKGDASKPTIEQQANLESSMSDLGVAENEEEDSCAEELESILGILFVSAQNSQTKIRWSAAKGIARLSSRMSRERAGEVIDQAMESFFHKLASEFAWHGGCLTLAELSRHGLLLEEKLARALEIVEKAVVYDKIKGSFAVGAHVREASCYILWALARNYEEHLLKQHLEPISTQLLCTILFDRELQCRRAASATFQELVGRQGAFTQEGIDILTKVDHQNVGQRQFTYLQLAPQIAGYKVIYAKAFVNNLVNWKIGHWDPQIRRLASDALPALMLHLDGDYIRVEVINQLRAMIDQTDDVNIRHGAILALAKVIKGLVPLQFEFSEDLPAYLGKLQGLCDKQLKSKQQAPNFMEAICLVISAAAAGHFKYEEDSEVLKQWERLTFAALDSDKADLRDLGSDALLTLYETYYQTIKAHQDRLLFALNKSLASMNESSRCGALRALSKLSRVVSSAPSNTTSSGSGSTIRTDADTPDIILMSLTSYIAKETHEKAIDIVFAQAKAEACDALVNFVRGLDRERLFISANLLQAAYDALLEKTEDYTFDKRGDIGVVVRRAAVKALEELTLHLLSIGMGERSMFNRNRVTNMIARILQQSVSYNNSCRELAARAFHKLIGSDLPEDTIAHKGEILALLAKYGVIGRDGECSCDLDLEFNWRDDSTPIFVSLLSKEEYSLDLWAGLLPSVGQVSDMCARQFRTALCDYLQGLSDESPQERDLVFAAFLSTLEREDMADRLVTSGLIVADYLLTQGLMNDTSEHFQSRLAEFAWKCQTNSKDPKRLISVSRVLSSMLQFSGQVQSDCLRYCLALLCNGFAKVRVYMAEQLYLALLTYHSDSESLQQPMDLLRETDWAEPLEKVRPVRDQISALALTTN